MKKILLSTVSLFALASAAGAADMPLKAAPLPVAPTWAGFYLGIQGGVADHRGSIKDLDNFAFGGTATYSTSKTGGIFGANAGYNFQSGNLVYGVEADWNWIGAKATATVAPSILPVTTSFDVRWLATARARLGLAADATLFYVTGGAAFGQVDNNVTVFNPLGTTIRGTFSQNTTKVGWTVGGGVEHMFGPHWTARAEVSYVDLGRSTVNCTPGTSNCLVFGGGSTYRGEFRNSLVLGLLALDYKF
jgi:outer membrane immunogenic protein